MDAHFSKLKLGECRTDGFVTREGEMARLRQEIVEKGQILVDTLWGKSRRAVIISKAAEEATAKAPLPLPVLRPPNLSEIQQGEMITGDPLFGRWVRDTDTGYLCFARLLTIIYVYGHSPNFLCVVSLPQLISFHYGEIFEYGRHAISTVTLAQALLPWIRVWRDRFDDLRISMVDKRIPEFKRLHMMSFSGINIEPYLMDIKVPSAPFASHLDEILRQTINCLRPRIYLGLLLHARDGCEFRQLKKLAISKLIDCDGHRLEFILVKHPDCFSDIIRIRHVTQLPNKAYVPLLWPRLDVADLWLSERLIERAQIKAQYCGPTERPEGSPDEKCEDDWSTGFASIGGRSLHNTAIVASRIQRFPRSFGAFSSKEDVKTRQNRPGIFPPAMRRGFGN